VLEDRQLNQAGSKSDPVNRPERTARTTVHHYNGTQYCSTETVLLPSSTTVKDTVNGTAVVLRKPFKIDGVIDANPDRVEALKLIHTTVLFAECSKGKVYNKRLKDVNSTEVTVGKAYFRLKNQLIRTYIMM